MLPDQGLPSNGASSPSPAWAAACLVWACGRRGRYVPARLTHLTGLSAAAAAAALAALLLVLGRWDAFPSQQSIQSSAWASLHPTRRKPVIKPLPITPPSVCSWLHSIPSSTNVRWRAPPCRVIFDKNHWAASMQPLPDIRLSTIGTVPVPQMAAAIRGGARAPAANCKSHLVFVSGHSLCVPDSCDVVVRDSELEKKSSGQLSVEPAPSPSPRAPLCPPLVN